MRTARIGLLYALLVAAQVCSGQTLEPAAAEGPVPLRGPWLITAGDPPGGARDASDSSGGQRALLAAPPHFASTPQILWFRATLVLPEAAPQGSTAEPLGLLIAPRARGCQIFINGTQAADCDQLPAANDLVQRGLLVHLPASPAEIAIAIRLVHPDWVRNAGPPPTSDLVVRRGFGHGPLGLGPGDVLFGTISALEDRRAARDAAHFFDLLPQTLLCLAEFAGGVIVLIAFGGDRRRHEYLWFAAFLFLDGSGSILSVFQRVYPLLSPFGHDAVNTYVLIARYALLIGFLACFTGVRMNRWVRAYQVVLAVLPLAIIAEFRAAEAGGAQHFGGTGTLLLAELPFVFGSLIFLAVQWQRGNKEAGLLLLPFLVANGTETLMLAGPAFRRPFHAGRFGFDLDDVSMFFFLVSIAPVLALRHRRITLQHARATAELDAGREMQQQLVPASLPAVEGYALEAAYRPAEEVGGDFYQVLARDDGSAMLVVGDVSGKGLKAAMRGAMALGLVRAYSAENLSPGDLLQRMNREMRRTREEGFITCICAWIRTSGEVAIANAGHLAPYFNGTELPVDTGFPLGIFSESNYTSTRLTLAPGDRLTFLSDGVVEARNAEGELYGFERTRGISGQTAESIAEAAQRFGQEDDITVVTVAFNPAA